VLVLFAVLACGGLDTKLCAEEPPPLPIVGNGMEPEVLVEPVETLEETVAPPVAPTADALSATTRARTRQATIAVRSFTPEQTLEAIVANLSELGGTVQSSNTGSARIYVPDTAFEEALATINKLGEVVVEDVSSEDVTLERVTLQARIQELEASRQRVKGMLAKSTTVTDSLAVERDLQQVTQEIETNQGRLNYLDSRVRSAPLDVSVSMQARPQAETLRRGRPFEWVAQYGLEAILPR